MKAVERLSEGERWGGGGAGEGGARGEAIDSESCREAFRRGKRGRARGEGEGQ